MRVATHAGRLMSAVLGAALLCGLWAAPRNAAAEGLDARGSHAAIAFFLQEIATQAPDFLDSLPALKSAGYNPDEDLVFVDPSGWIRISFPADQAALMTYVLEDWAGEMSVFERVAEDALGAPPTVLEDETSPLMWESRVNGETVTFVMMPGERGGVRFISLTAFVEPDERGS